MPIFSVPDSDSLPQPPYGLKEGKGGEIHSAKAHRCVDKVRAKGHGESSAWAICTSSIGKAGVYAKGHGGKASPKRKVHEADGEMCADCKAGKKCKHKKPMMEKAFSKAPYGSGGRFKSCQASGKSAALCAYIGRRAHGAKSMARVAAKGRAREAATTEAAYEAAIRECLK